MPEIKVQSAIYQILNFLGEPETFAQKESLEKFSQLDTKAVRFLALSNMNDYFCQCLAIMADALIQEFSLSYILNASASAACEHRHTKNLAELSRKLTEFLNSDNPALYGREYIYKFLIPEKNSELASLEAFSAGDISNLRFWAKIDSKNPFHKALIQLHQINADDPEALIIIFIKAGRNALKHDRTRQMRGLRLMITQSLESSPVEIHSRVGG